MNQLHSPSKTAVNDLNEAMRKTAIPERMRYLPVSPAGFPVPWFVQWFADATRTELSPCGVGVPDFRCVDDRKIAPAIKRRLCWVCGGALGRRIAFVIGPMCAVSRVTSEPGCHRDCAIFAATACPFLSNPRMRRNDKALPEIRHAAAGVPLDRNPGVACVWITQKFKPFHPQVGNAGLLIRLAAPDSVSWHARGRDATRSEVLESITSGMPALRAVADLQGNGATELLEQGFLDLMPLLPPPERTAHDETCHASA